MSTIKSKHFLSYMLFIVIIDFYRFFNINNEDKIHNKDTKYIDFLAFKFLNLRKKSRFFKICEIFKIVIIEI